MTAQIYILWFGALCFQKIASKISCFLYLRGLRKVICHLLNSLSSLLTQKKLKEPQNTCGHYFLTHCATRLVLKGPVHRTKKKTKIGLNWTSGLFMDRSFAVQLAVFPF
ncbi:hypothetical protein L208DRAFT_1295770 [Tricholoma matsutake]|nr:hypothetical protein L208DRAFT_1295770 [Tricholoma matsutake 945]